MTRLGRLLAALREFYGAQPTPPGDAFALFVWDALASRTTPFKRDAAMTALKRVPALTPDSTARAPQAKLELSVKAAGPYHEQRLQALRAGAEFFRRHVDVAAAVRGPLLPARRALSGLPPLGDGEVHRMLLFAGSHLVLPMDPGTLRVGERLGYGAGGGPHRRVARRVRRALSAELEPTLDAFRAAATYLPHHALATCLEREPHCGVCPIASDCPAARTQNPLTPNL